MSGEGMGREEIRARIASFPRWHYSFDLKGCRTPIHKKEWANRHRQREAYFFDPLVEWCGGSLRGKRVLDLGCNAGYWALKAVEHGCDHVVGVDAREMHIRQAEFVFEVLEVPPERFDFVAGDVFDVDLEKLGRFDVVLCLGLIYHVAKPIALMENIARVNSDLLIIDTFLSGAEGSFLEVGFERTSDPRLAFDQELVLRPTRQAVFDIARQFGYQVFMLEPGFDDYTGAEVYRDGSRRAFVCAKRTDPSRFPNLRARANRRT